MSDEDMKRKDPKVYAAAAEITELTNIGEYIVMDARKKATAGMAKMVDNLRSKEAKIEALKHHGIYLGAAAQFNNNVMKQSTEMRAALEGITGDPKYVDILMDFWMAKILREVASALVDADK